MSFFGFDDKSTDIKDTKEYTFDDTYDGLGQQLQESGDDFNDETFGSFAVNDVGKDFEFGLSSSNATDVNNNYQQKPQSSSQAGMPSLQPIASLWGAADQAQKLGTNEVFDNNNFDHNNYDRSTFELNNSGHGNYDPTNGTGIPGKILSLEEVEAQLRAASLQQPQFQQPLLSMPGQFPPHQFQQFPPHMQFPPLSNPNEPNFQFPPQMMQPPFQQMGIPPMPMVVNQHSQSGQSISQNSNGPHAPQTPYQLEQPNRTPVKSLEEIRNQDLAMAAAEQDKAIRKSKKMSEISKYNNLMNHKDKDYVMRMQLAQFVTDDSYNEDFYYRVHTAIQSRHNPQQSQISNIDIAQAYVFQQRGNNRGNRYRGRNDSPLERLQQQVQRAVAYVKQHPKKNLFVFEGSLGNITTTSGKAPRQALKIKKPSEGIPSLTSGDNLSDLLTPTEKSSVSSPAFQLSPESNSSSNFNPPSSASRNIGNDKKGPLYSIEKVYSILLQLENTERTAPQSDPSSDEFKEWQDKMRSLLEELWDALQIMVPFDAVEGPSQVHPFIAMLSYNKGMKLIPRIFRHINKEQRLTILTMIVAHMSSLEVIRQGSYTTVENNEQSNDLPLRVREAIELFSQTVLPPLVHFISDTSYSIVVGLLGILMDRNDISYIATTKTGLAFLTVFISRAELISQEGNVTQSELELWNTTFDNLFRSLHGHLSSIFPSSNNIDDSYVWQFLASVALAAKLEHQRIMVDEVRDSIFGAMNEAKLLSPEHSHQKIANLNLFLNVMGLNATTTEISELKINE
ncbi:hypothetical protein NADFUDRAFT_81861 [Nadsonia fulvescens var. elongata DSM 6958]|uniref:mRNA decay factor PAT1 domain-containing protein n=1 Tax=Nadsonia fulvescens var. elongata DSM 6958 TaxID=857566 RepID=A0A1E3PPJ8_9ASCO|nr:hypothetical protein NADFUDRAFT_81861 [Nadsonia fulvescens var. elongata DSM 6958]